MLILHDLTPEKIYDAYVETLCWYRDMLSEDAGESEGAETETPADV